MDVPAAIPTDLLGDRHADPRDLAPRRAFSLQQEDDTLGIALTLQSGLGSLESDLEPLRAHLGQGQKSLINRGAKRDSGQFQHTDVRRPLIICAVQGGPKQICRRLIDLFAFGVRLEEIDTPGGELRGAARIVLGRREPGAGRNGQTKT